MNKLILNLVLLVSVSPLNSMEQAESGLDVKLQKISAQTKLSKVLCISHIKRGSLENLFVENQKKVSALNYSAYDLGQEHSIKELADKFDNYNESEKVTICATCADAAAAINYLAHVDKGKKIKALILNYVFASGNQLLKDLLKDSISVNLPFSYYWLPYLEISIPYHSPAGKQPIKSIKSIPNNIPIIIIHRINPFLSADGAHALYYGLRENGNDNVYLVSVGNRVSNNLIQLLIQSILKKHKLISSKKQEDVDLRFAQPDHRQYEQIYRDLLSKEQNHEKLVQLAPKVAKVAVGVMIGTVLIIIVYKVLITISDL